MLYLIYKLKMNNENTLSQSNKLYEKIINKNTYIYPQNLYTINENKVVTKVEKYAILLSERTQLFFKQKRDTFDLSRQMFLSPSVFESKNIYSQS